MKLILCPKCSDIVRLQNEKRYCMCKKSWGNYIDDLNAVIGGESVPLGIDNFSFVDAFRETKISDRKLGEEFIAFFIKLPCDSIKREN